MRVLIGPDLTDGEDLAELYAVPADHDPDRDAPWLRVNLVSTVDGAATGTTGTSSSINNAVDKAVFDHLRDWCEVIVVGAGTARIEGYRPAGRPLVVVSRSGGLPESLQDAPEGSVLVMPVDDPPAFKRWLAAQGWRRVLCEGGPSLLRDLLAGGVVDELCTTTVPRAVAGQHTRITAGAAVDVPLRLHALAECDGTLLARWRC